MPYLILILSLCFLPALLHAQGPKVKSLDFKDFVLDEEDDEGKLKMLKREYKEYDSKGRLTKFTTYDVSPTKEPVKTSELVKAYEEEGRSEEQSKFDEGGQPIFYEKSFFDKNDKRIGLEFIDYPNGGTEKMMKIFTYTDFGKPQTIILLNSQNKKLGEEKWKYNKDEEEVEYNKWEEVVLGQKYQETKKTIYNKDGTLASAEKLIRDGNDTYKEEITFERNRVKEQVKYKNGEIVSQFGGNKKTTYDPSKAKVMMDFGSGGDEDQFGMWTTEDEFDEQGRKIKTVQKLEEVISKATFYEYDDRGNLIKEKKVAYEDEFETEVKEDVFEYDKYNNLLRKANYLNGILMSEKTYDYKYH